MSIVDDHYAKPSSYVDTLKEQIDNGMYAHLFEGKKDLVFLDIGANIGLVSAYAYPFCKRIVALEPSPNVYPVLRQMCPNIETYCVALAPSDGDCEFFVNDVNSTASSTVNTYGTLTKVQGLRLSTILTKYKLDHIDVCKCDAEGAEGESLDYYQIDNAKDIIKTYFIETHNCPKTSWEHKLGTIVGNLARCGYHEMRIDGMAVTATRP